MIKHELIIYWSESDQAFIVEVPELPGCMADGQTYVEAVTNAEVVISEWIETAQELGAIFQHLKGGCCMLRSLKDDIRADLDALEGMLR